MEHHAQQARGGLVAGHQQLVAEVQRLLRVHGAVGAGDGQAAQHVVGQHSAEQGDRRLHARSGTQLVAHRDAPVDVPLERGLGVVVAIDVAACERGDRDVGCGAHREPRFT